MTLVSNIKVFQHTAGKLCKLCWGIKPHPRQAAHKSRRSLRYHLCAEQVREPPNTDLPGCWALQPPKTEDGAGNLTWIGPVGTHSDRKGLLDLACILSTPGHAFKEKTSTRAHVLIQTWVLFLCREMFIEVSINGMRKFPSAKDPF